MNLKQLRKEKKATQQDIANFLNVSRATYNGYELEKYEPTIDTLKKLADYYSVSVDYLISRNFKSFIAEDNKEINEIFNQLTIINKGKVIGYAKGRLEEQKESNNKNVNWVD